MYRVNPLTYVVEGFLGTSVANAPITCASNEIITFQPADNATCDDYLREYLSVAGGYVANGSGGSREECQYCPMGSTNDFLSTLNIEFANRWRDFGFLWAYIIFNVAGAVLFYWLARVPKAKVKKN
jgi:ABC-type multidrug transport system permease subunit